VAPRLESVFSQQRSSAARVSVAESEGMSVPQKPVITPIVSMIGKRPPQPSDDKMTCERCGAEMYRMHAVWRCPECRFKTDCCGW